MTLARSRPASGRPDLAIRCGLGLVAGGLFALLAFPIAALLLAAPPRELLRGLQSPLVWPALALTITTTLISLALVVGCGTPLAWAIARGRGRGWQAVETMAELPAVLPPAVAGVALLLAFGRRGLLGPALASAGIGLPFTGAAVVIAQSFVAAPFYLQAAISAFRRLDPDLVLVARTLGASPARIFLTLAVPIARPVLASGAALAWARALGEFGATLMFAGNMPGRTQTLPLAIYTALESNLRTAQSLSIALVAVALALLAGVRAREARVMGLDVDVEGQVGEALTVRLTLHATDRPVILMGPNGAGKTSALLLIAGGLSATRGRLTLDDRVLLDTAAAIDVPTEARAIGFVPQRYALFPHLDVLGNVAYGIRAPQPERRRLARAALAALEVESLASRMPQALSGGEMQRVALARALAARPRALLLDEPLAALDPSVRRDTRRFLAARLRAWSLPTIVVTHDRADAEALDGTVVVLEAGAVVQRGSLAELTAAPATAFVRELVGTPVPTFSRS